MTVDKSYPDYLGAEARPFFYDQNFEYIKKENKKKSNSFFIPASVSFL